MLRRHYLVNQAMLLLIMAGLPLPAANALLGKVLMQTGDYAGAKTAFLKIPTSGADGYQLTDRYLDNFEEENPN